MKKTVIIEIREGQVQFIAADTESVNVVIVDHDNLEASDNEDQVNTQLTGQKPEQINCKQFIESVKEEYLIKFDL